MSTSCDCPFGNFLKKFLYFVKDEKGESRPIYVNEEVHQKIRQTRAKYPDVIFTLKEGT